MRISDWSSDVCSSDLLVGRKLALDGGTLTQRFFALIRAELDAALPTAGEGLVAPVAQALARLERVTQRLAGSGGGAELGAAATDYLRLFALVSFGWMWVRMAAAVPALDEATAVELRKTALASFFVERMLPQTLGLATALPRDASPPMAPDPPP